MGVLERLQRASQGRERRRRCAPRSDFSLLLPSSPSWSATALAEAGPASPHVLVILADDLGWGDLSCYGNRMVATPQLDRLAREGLRLGQFYAAADLLGVAVRSDHRAVPWALADRQLPPDTGR